MKAKISIYTDGGYSIPRGVGGYAFIVVENNEIIHEFSSIAERSTSARMEIQAFIEALKYANKNYSDIVVNIYTDNQYVVQGYNTWMEGWKSCGWKKADKKPIKNLDLWLQIYELKSSKIKSNWVRGHNEKSGNINSRFNAIVDGKTRDYLV